MDERRNKSWSLQQVFVRLLALALATLSAATGMNADDTRARVERFQLWNDCRPVRLRIDDLSEHEAKIGLTKEAVAVAVRSRLRAARIYTDGDITATEAPAAVYMSIGVVGPAFTVHSRFAKAVRDIASGVSNYATTWDYGQYGTHGDDPDAIIRAASKIADRFLDDYLRVNEAACAARERKSD